MKYIKHVETNRTGTALPVFQRISTHISTFFNVFHVFQLFNLNFLKDLKYAKIGLNTSKYVESDERTVFTILSKVKVLNEMVEICQNMLKFDESVERILSLIHIS